MQALTQTEDLKCKSFRNERLYDIALIAIFTALLVASRFALAAVPNVKPILATVILLAVFRSPKVGAATGAMTMLISSMFAVFGVWTVNQIVALAVIAGAASIVGDRKGPLLVFSGVAGFLYGIMMLPSTMVFMPDAAILPIWLSGLSFDFTQAVSTVCFVALLYAPCKGILRIGKGR